METAVGYIKENPYAVSGALLAGVALWSWNKSRNEVPIPTYGFGIPVPTILVNIKMMIEGHGAFLKMYAKYPMCWTTFRGGWTILVQGKYIDEMNAAPDDVLSFEVAMKDVLQTRYTMGVDVADEGVYHHKPIQNQMTRKLHVVYPDVYDETVFAFSDRLKEAETGWQTVKAMEFVQNVVACASNRVFVGLPLCRNPEWLALMQKNAIAVVATTYLINAFPKFMHPIVGPLFSTIESKVKQASDLMGSLVDDRLAMDPQDWPEDYVSWLLNVAPEEDKCTREVAKRVLMVNFAAIHTSTMNLTHALYWLLARPQYIESIRQEIEEITDEMGWTKDAISHMARLDCFMKECQRMNPLGLLVMNRLCLKPFAFSNGVKIPPGTMLSAHQWAIHRDGQNYSNPDVFDGERFLEKDWIRVDEVGAGADGEKGGVKGEKAGARKTMYSTSRTYMAFGHGKHACPGRFFASLELKGIMAYIIANYDLKWPDNAKLDANGRPKDMWVGATNVPNSSARICFRKRNKA